MSLEHILLGLLRKPASGYDLKGQFDRSVRYFWAAELSQIYPTLQRMQKRGWLTSETKPSARGPKRRVYSITPAGRKVLKDWLLEGPHLREERYGFVAQLFFMDAAGDWRETKRFVTGLREVLRGRLETYRKIDRDWLHGETEFPDPHSRPGFHQYMALRGGLYHLTARIKWCDEVIKQVNARIRASTSSHRTMGNTSNKKKRKNK